MTATSTTAPAAPINAGDRLGFTIFLALAIHAILIFGVSFTSDDRNSAETLPSIDIILAHSHSQETPEEYDFLAQADQQGGGESDEKARPSAPVSANTPINRQGLDDQVSPERRKQAAQSEQLEHVTQREATEQVVQQPAPSQSTMTLQADIIDQRRKTIASLQAEIRQMAINYAKRPKILTLTASSKKSVEAGYLAGWVKRIEHVGNLNYPERAVKEKISGQLRLNVTLDRAGNILDIRVSQSSGHSLLDESARQIVRLAQPFAPLPKEMQEYADQIIIIRTWKFDSKGLSTDA